VMIAVCGHVKSEPGRQSTSSSAAPKNDARNRRIGQGEVAVATWEVPTSSTGMD
jgi:hypothetical protein